MRLTRYRLSPLLDRHVHQMWVFESDAGLPPGDLRTVVPNGRTRLILPLAGSLSTAAAGRSWTVPTGRAALVGQWETPAVLSAPDAPLITIGVEFKAAGLSALHPGPLSEFTGGIVAFDDLIGPLATRLVARAASAATPAEAAGLVREGLEALVRRRDPDERRPTDAAIDLMRASGFRIGMEDLERRMGYSRRHLLTLFQRDVGLSPSRIQAILAFERIYRDFARHGSARAMIASALDRFHDQSHFTRVFRDLAGLPPARFAAAENRFGRLFYQDDARPD